MSNSITGYKCSKITKYAEKHETEETNALKIRNFISEIKSEIGKPKFEYKSFCIDETFYKEVCEKFENDMYEGIKEQNKEIRNDNVDKIAEKIKDFAIEFFGENAQEEHLFDINTAVHDLEKECVRKMILTEHKRPDGRQIDEIRKLSAEVGILPRTHGSAVFTRGQTQVLSVVTLGTKTDEQILDGLDEEEYKRYMHQYHFPS